MGSTWTMASGESRIDSASRAISASGCALAKAVAVANNDDIGEQFRQKVVATLGVTCRARESRELARERPTYP